LTESEDPLEYYPKYGAIVNPLVKRRPNRRPPPHASVPSKAAQPAAKPKTAESVKEALKPASIPSAKPEPKQQSGTAKDFFGKGKEKAQPAGASEPSSKESTPAPNPPNLKRDSSSLFKAFAKAKPKLKSEGTGSSAGAEDEVMTDAVHFDEDEEETYVPPVQDEESTGDRKSRKEREAKLRAMMEEDDEDEVPPAAKPEPEPEPEEEEEEEATLEQEKVKEEPEPPITVSGGRRRGKRRVMRKKTIKDDEGYLGKLSPLRRPAYKPKLGRRNWLRIEKLILWLVTIEEPAWESFSEDEPVASVMKVRPQVGSTGPKGKKVPDKKGQGSIMSFFGKK
jgi:DNA polymerase delta subunit 3